MSATDTKVAVRALILHEGKILLVRHRGKDFYALPGGKVDPGEDIKSALSRELMEELGVDSAVEKMQFVHEFRYPKSETLSLEFFFTVKDPAAFLDWKPSTHTEEELEEISWKDLSEDFPLRPAFLKDFFPHLPEEITYCSTI